ncbi:MAG: GDP-mannose 4,6-dehydratase [Brevefilum sp.]|nr:GDP-mannose 4,6-dehydratase [Brevefilum sp.]
MSNRLDGSRVLVTGAGGFIGSELVNRLDALGASVRAFLRYTSRAEMGLLSFLPPDTRSRLDLTFGDLRDPDAVEKAVAGVDVVFHLGALISIPYSYIHPVEVVHSNVLGTLNVLQACRRHGACLVHTSTSEVYGTALRVPIDEGHPLQGQSPYSASKIGADKLVESYYRAFDVQAVTVRPFNTYGPGQSARAVIPTIITQALTMEEIHLGNLDAKRDFTYLSDTVEGFIKAAQAEGVAGETFNLGYGDEVSIGALVDLILELVGRPVKVVVDEERLRPEKSEVMRLLSDNTKAREVLGWQPQVDIREGLSRTIAWIREHLDLYRVGEYEK